jgi:hypothetical protein
MNNRHAIAIIAAGLLLSGCAVNYAVQPEVLAQQTVRYERGVPTVFDDKTKGTIQITPMGVSQDGRPYFGMAVFNKGSSAANFGIENVTAVDDFQKPLKAYSRDELAHEAKVKAEWQAVAAVVAGAAAAYGAQQNAYGTTNGYIVTPRGNVATFNATSYDPSAAAIGTAAAGAATGYTLSAIENNMDATLNNLNGAILQTTTIDPGRSYGGEVVIEMPKGRDFPKKLVIQTVWNGEPYEFGFTISKSK